MTIANVKMTKVRALKPFRFALPGKPPQDVETGKVVEIQSALVPMFLKNKDIEVMTGTPTSKLDDEGKSKK